MTHEEIRTLGAAGADNDVECTAEAARSDDRESPALASVRLDTYEIDGAHRDHLADKLGRAPTEDEWEVYRAGYDARLRRLVSAARQLAQGAA